ncbi:hypothetical protein EDB86DRAFT_3086704 [Lactarius hatsudake]|nr:hypothetical protein EDB86DRAFT_3086704 [Lactarius hatsudake]
MHSLGALDDALKRFHRHREIFREVGVHIKGFNLPRQHSLVHYAKLIRAYGAPNGLCSSIMESKHIKAVKEPWRRSNHFDALSQMLLTNQHLDKLAAARVDFTNRDMLKGTCILSVLGQILCMNTGRAQVDPSHEPLISDSSSLLGNNASSGNGNINEDEDDDGADIAGPTVEAHVDLSKVPLRKVYPDDIAAELAQPDFPCLIRKFIYDQEHLDSTSDIMSVSSTAHPMFYGKITVYPSAIATFQAPSDISGTGGMHCERIHAVTSWRKGASRYDTVFVNADSTVEEDSDRKGLTRADEHERNKDDVVHLESLEEQYTERVQIYEVSQWPSIPSPSGRLRGPLGALSPLQLTDLGASFIQSLTSSFSHLSPSRCHDSPQTSLMDLSVSFRFDSSEV